MGNKGYYGLMTSTWDLLRSGHENWDDRFLFQEVIGQYGEPALDVGCATGRLILTYLEEGIDVDGVDNSAEMLALCRTKAKSAGLQPTLYEQAMEKLDLPRTYKTIVASSSSFQLLTDFDASREAMDRFRRHLEPGGALVMPFMTLWSEGDPIETDWQLTGEATREGDGATVRRWGRSRYDREAQFESAEYRYEVSLHGDILAEEKQTFAPETRSYTQQQAVDTYAAAGFEGIRVWREFSTDPATDSDKLFTVLGVSP